VIYIGDWCDTSIVLWLRVLLWVRVTMVSMRVAICSYGLFYDGWKGLISLG